MAKIIIGGILFMGGIFLYIPTAIVGAWFFFIAAVILNIIGLGFMFAGYLEVYPSPEESGIEPAEGEDKHT